MFVLYWYLSCGYVYGYSSDDDGALLLKRQLMLHAGGNVSAASQRRNGVVLTDISHMQNIQGKLASLPQYIV